MLVNKILGKKLINKTYINKCIKNVPLDPWCCYFSIIYIIFINILNDLLFVNLYFNCIYIYLIVILCAFVIFDHQNMF